MATTEPLLPFSDEPCDREPALGEAVTEVGPLRNPDGCVLLCPDCSCRRLLDERRSKLAADTGT
jgi:hypothetical protein